MIDWKRFNWPEIFGVIHSVKPMLSQNQFRMMATDIQERATARYSDGQLKYVGNTEIGKDFIGCDGLRYESKMSGKLIQKKDITKDIILKNFRGNILGVPEQTFDYMMAWDYGVNTVLLADWDTCMLDCKVKGAVVNITLDIRRCEIIAENVIPVKNNPDDTLQKYNDFVDSFVSPVMPGENDFMLLTQPQIDITPLRGTLGGFLK